MVVRVSIINSIVGRDAAKISLRNIFLLAYAITAQMNRYPKIRKQSQWQSQLQ